MRRWPFVKEKHTKAEPRMYVLFVFKLDDVCYDVIKKKTSAINEMYSWLPRFRKQTNVLFS